MIATHNQPSLKDEIQETNSIHHIKNLNKSPFLLPTRSIKHHPKAGLNPLVDAASSLFAVLGKLKTLKSYQQLNKLQKKLIQEINMFQEVIRSRRYNPEYRMVCNYVICVSFDDIISNTEWGNHDQWENFSLLRVFNHDAQYPEKFFTVMERAIKEPTLYIDLMEFMYICLSMGFKGQYRSTEHGQYELEQITHNLYKHIRAYRGSFSKTLSPTPLKAHKLITDVGSKKMSALFIFFVTACIIMTIFISLGYLMDVISNEAYKTIPHLEKTITD